MDRGPAVIIVARHGARLDAADKAWHLTSPAPYDPPLTYGGWTQSKALGLRIASLLHAQTIEAEAGSTPNGPNADLAHLEFTPLDEPQCDQGSRKRGRRRHKIVIHSSPYLRCIQTSTAIAAGIAQYQPPGTSTLKSPTPTKSRNGLSRTPTPPSPGMKSVAVAADANPDVPYKRQAGPNKSLLRIDAFLGEWLSPDYFEGITPPPNSTMMVAGAKSDLLRREDYVEVPQPVHNNHGHFPGGWVKSNGSAAVTSPFSGRNSTQEAYFPTLASLGQTSPRRERSNSQGSVGSRGSRTWGRGVSAISTTRKVPNHIYDPPIPSYAVSPADPIPKGYTTHARDACVDIDFRWDSTRRPQDWGDGGQYGDEWSTMHKRFRKGLAGVMAWYWTGYAGPRESFPGFTFRNHRPLPLLHRAPDPRPVAGSPVEDDEDLVLILVTHAAGCNALLGAISNQPVLLDIGVASLSMAVRRSELPKNSMSTSTTARRPSVADVGISDDYDLKLLASVDHLRAGVDPSKPPKPQSPAVVSSPSLEYRRRVTKSGKTNSPIDSPFALGQTWTGTNSSLGSIRRKSSSGSSSQAHSTSQGSASPSLGLWGGPQAPSRHDSTQDRRSPAQDPVTTLQGHKPASTSVITNDRVKDLASSMRSAKFIDSRDLPTEIDHVSPLPRGLGRTSSQSRHGLWQPNAAPPSTGLWGPPRTENICERAHGSKRRWTVSEPDPEP